jgi:ATP-dependent Lhr-like helicase
MAATSPLATFDPLIAAWFERRFAAATEPQVQGWPLIREGRDVLISAPTGSGKTLAAFLICLDGLVQQARAGTLENVTEVLYVSPLKALSNDIHKNLEIPLAEICGGADLLPIHAAVRTGDTPAWERQRMLGKPPHVLVTTPESFFILVTTERGRRMLSTVRTVIVDEIHAVAGDKRGSHLALSLARLDALVESNGRRRPQRIGLSATVKPLEGVAKFLGSETQMVQVGHRRAMELAVVVPRDELSAVASTEMWGEIYDRLAELIRENRTTLVFVNTRRLAERVAHHLGERLGGDAVLPHHGSLSRKLRLNAEERLKKGELRAVVATASLELGIDIGTVDLVCQIGTPRSIAVALQRVGRSGHWVGAMPKGRFFATTRDDLIENAALVRAIRSGELDRIFIPRAPLDVLAQQIVAAAACDDWAEDDLYDMARGCFSYSALKRHDFDAVIEMLSEGIATSRGRSGAYLHRDQVNGRVKGRRGARLAAVTSGGAIPDNANYQVVAEPEGVTVGTVDEDFAVEAAVGDIFLLGTTSWKIRRIESGRVRVEAAPGATPSIPFWNGEAPGRTLELSREVSKLREAICNAGSGAVELLIKECGLDQRGAEQAAQYVIAGRDALGALPTCETVVAERFFDEAGGMQLILHAPFGARITRAWGLALRKRFCRNFNFELQAAATDNGLVISLSEQHAFPLEVIYQFLKVDTLEHMLSQALLASPMFQARWRWNASRALAVLRFSGGRKTPPPIQRMRSDDLLAAVFPDQAACPENLTGEPKIPDHPLVNETIDNCLHQAMDLDSLREIIRKIHSGEIRTVAVDTPEASPFSHEILNSNPYSYLDDAPLEERRARAVELRRTLPSGAGEVGQLDAAAIAEVREQAWPAVRDADELHDALLTLGVLPPVDEWRESFATLSANRRATTLVTSGVAFWVAAERLELVRGLYNETVVSPDIAAVAGKDSCATKSQEECATAVMRGWLELSGPVRASEMAARLALPAWLTEAALLRLEGSGEILRGRFTPSLSASDEIEWCNRRLLARIHRLTLGRLRREIEPVTSAQFVRFLCRWQHVATGTRLHGVEGLFAIIRQLQGYEISAAAWESEILPRRMVGYKPEDLDRLCLSGEVAWGRLAPRNFETSGENPVARRVRPTRVAPLSIFLREDCGWLLPPRDEQLPLLSHQAQAVLAELQRRGASFFGELQRGSGRLASEVEDALWELVAAGLVTADGFENLRALLDPKRRSGQGRGRSARPRHAAGRWSLLVMENEEASVGNFARQLLRRWGVLFRDLLARETLAPPWRDLLVELRRMEARGEVRGGRFVSGPVGEQYALPEAVDLLRAVRRDAESEAVTISAADPLNLCGVVLPGARISALSGGMLRLRDGVAEVAGIPA